MKSVYFSVLTHFLYMSPIFLNCRAAINGTAPGGDGLGLYPSSITKFFIPPPVKSLMWPTSQSVRDSWGVKSKKKKKNVVEAQQYQQTSLII